VHIDVVLEFINREMQYSLFKQVLTEVYEHRSNPIIFMAPL
jgi:hypothetical protein